MNRNASQRVVVICKQVFSVSALCFVTCIVWTQRVEAAQPTSRVIDSGGNSARPATQIEPVLRNGIPHGSRV
jgi:hypothetical protein